VDGGRSQEAAGDGSEEENGGGDWAGAEEERGGDAAKGVHAGIVAVIAIRQGGVVLTWGGAGSSLGAVFAFEAYRVLWGVCYTRAREEERAAHGLRRQGYLVWLPMLERGGGKVEVLFPRYLFVDISGGVKGIGGTRGVVGLLKNGDRISVVPASVLGSLLGEMDQLVQLKRRKKGDRILVTEGGFEGMTGLYEGMNGRQRVGVLLELMGRGVRVELPEGWLADM
jgi:transcriptional antiterminator RfaH